MSLNADFSAEYAPPTWLKGGHAQTVVPKFVRQATIDYRRELRADSHGTAQVAYDFVDGAADAPLVVLFHGLEGSSSSHYAIALAHAVRQRGWRYVVVHFRSCGGVPNTSPVFYHSGDSAEIAFVLNQLKQDNPELFAVGVSLGGNALAKYLGEEGVQAACSAAASISAPLDLPAAAIALRHPVSRRIYIPYFLRTLVPKARALCTDAALEQKLRHCRSLTEFDNLFTAPLHGFADAQDYYRRASSKPLLPEITVPTLILNAQNDPFLPASALPRAHEVSRTVTLLQPAQGGHVGFLDTRRHDKLSWLPETVLDFFAMHRKL
ncbi:MAG: alpha/beta fold hydrolase [Neisseria sp.]|nr:alpha/beta fold hydrolase [Neisseria sp.]